MSKIKIPLLSAEAKGSVYKLLTFSKNSHGAYVKIKKKKEPKRSRIISLGEKIQMNLFSLASQLWKVLSIEDKLLFQEKYKDGRSILRNIFIQFYLLKRPLYTGKNIVGLSNVGKSF